MSPGWRTRSETRRSRCRPSFPTWRATASIRPRHSNGSKRSLALFAVELPDPKRRAAAFRLFVHWLAGFLLDATSGFAKGPSAADPTPDEVVAERFPMVAALGPFNRAEAHDELFEIGLRSILRAIHEL